MLLGKEPAVVETYVGGNSEIRTSGNTNTRTGYYWRKRMVNGNCKAAGVAGYDGRFRFYRLGKIYLNAAEAAMKADTLPKAWNGSMKSVIAQVLILRLICRQTTRTKLVYWYATNAR